MSFCCGASMIGVVGTWNHQYVKVHHVPLLCCPVCQNVIVHPAVKEEFDLVVEYAQEDQVKEITLRESVTPEMIDEWKEICVSFQDDDSERVIREQIDHSLDLLSIAKQLEDQSWEEDLKNRLRVLSLRLRKLEENKESSK
ncbi:hypothetical protein [Thermoflavimicrobium dichotomicum]|uniref:YgiT-type zinc finger domain-containing protein n=1 Tax=Thermoflavimicrobium dichotomicum TaxID=46223 RepID=A0A1I3RJ91_9BACL|nr:hypothetical protein [Thermoflavimicrobium dichotomicum]SFJ46653.1 hypothetical protein SAMN05421852_11071 [Thermoflavimicrobium dichotomicum]